MNFSITVLKYYNSMITNVRHVKSIVHSAQPSELYEDHISNYKGKRVFTKLSNVNTTFFSYDVISQFSKNIFKKSGMILCAT